MGQCLLSILSLGFLLHCLIEYFPTFSCVFTVYMKNYKDNARLRVMLSFFREDLHLLLADGCAVVILDYLNSISCWNHLKLGLSIRESWYVFRCSFRECQPEPSRFNRVPDFSLGGSWTPVFSPPSLRNHLKIQKFNFNSKLLLAQFISSCLFHDWQWPLELLVGVIIPYFWSGDECKWYYEISGITLMWYENIRGYYYWKIVTGTANSMFTFIIEGHTKFQLEVSKTKDLIFTSTSL